MDQLPIEVFLRIISFLDRDEQLHCLTICKTWRSHLEKGGSLYHSVTITDPQQFEKCTSFFDKYAEFKSQVKHLTIINTDIDVFALPKSFPNLEKLERDDSQKYNGWNDETPQDNTNKTYKKQFEPWVSTLTSITETGIPTVGPTLLKHHKCKQLISLTFGFVGVENDEDRKRDFIAHLKNAPNLQYLQLEWINMTLAHMDTLFKKTPNLKALRFCQVGFEPSKVRHSITVAPNLETLCIDQAYIMPGDRSWIPWFTKKCEKMKNFIFKISNDDDEYEPTVAFEMQIKHLLKSCNDLEYYNVQACPMTEGIIKVMNENENLKLKRVHLYGMEMFDDFKMLANSRQKDYIESLTLSGQPYCSLTFGDGKAAAARKQNQFFKLLGQFSKLKHFRINESKEEVSGQNDNVVHLDRFLELPHLETLTMDFATFEVQDTSDEPFNTNLKKLVMEESYAGALKFVEDKPPKRFMYGSEELKKDGIYHEEAMDFLESKLPHTEIVERQMEEEPADHEYAYLFPDN